MSPVAMARGPRSGGMQAVGRPTRSARIGPPGLLLADLGAAVPQADRDDDELGRVAGPDADLDVELAEGLEAGRVVSGVDPHVERLGGLLAEEGPGLPDAGEE